MSEAEAETTAKTLRKKLAEVKIGVYICQSVNPRLFSGDELSNIAEGAAAGFEHS